MSKRRLVRRVRDEIGAGLRLSPVLLVALVLALLVWRIDTAATSGLFQSSPVGTPTLMPTGSATPETPTAVPSAAPATQPPPEVPTEAPTATPPVAPPPTVTPVWTVTPAASSAEPTPDAATAMPDDRQRYPGDDSNVRFEWGMLFDSVSLFLSYTWLCCGVLLFLAIPAVFVVLWVASKRRRTE